GAGFIGSHLADALLARGDEVTVFDNLSTGKLENIDQALANGAELIEGDILDQDLVEKVMQSVRPQAVFHLAAQGEVQRSIEQPAFDATQNVVGTVNLIEASKNIGLDRFVFASTGGAIYGEGSNLELPASEEIAPEPLCQYGMSKLAGEQYLALYRRMYMFNSVALRFGNVYGPRQSPKGEAGAVAIFGELLMAGQNPVVFGDGLQTRDFVYIDDLIEAILTASRTDVEGPINLGSGEETSILDLLSGLREAGLSLNGDGPPEGTDFEPSFDRGRPGEVRRISIDPARAARELGWNPTTQLKSGLRETLSAMAASADDITHA
ncbi:MAG: GDP-mannose 4,6-dehydratase, partial [Solirubrobacterales bacterium]|nr:GDP-mannose 4,6-dehydratase [Solirubrobacterales bacterium]